MEYLLETKNISKSYGEKSVINNICIKVKKGEIYGFLGKNGAGKTTTIKIIMGLINASSGYVEVLGKKVIPGDYSYLKNIGSIIEYPRFYDGLSSYENLRLHMIYSNLEVNENTIDDYLEMLGLLKDKHRKVKEFSLGMKQRLGIARALIHEPEILILDEPTNGLDPKGIKEFREFITTLVKNKNITVIISSHILSEIQIIADRIGIINNGRLISEVNSRELNNSLDGYLRIKCDNILNAKKIIASKYNNLNISILNNWLEIRTTQTEVCSSEINYELVNNNIKVYEMVTIKESLEEYFIRLTGEEEWGN
ncbi:MAG: ABC transporter ATP-binding protein [Clostridium sp.]